MKKIKRILIILLAFLVMPNIVNAASGTINITGANTVVKGNTVTVTVTLKADTGIGSWQMDLDYDKSFLQLVKSNSESDGTSMSASFPNNQYREKSYTFTFKTLKTGTTTVKVTGYIAYAFDDFKEISLTSNGKSIRIMTQEELEATYSSDATLKNITVSKGELSPTFSRNTYNYSVEVENDVTSISVAGSRNDSSANVSGGGTIELEEGDNKVEIKVVAQKGNEQIYTVNIYRKELDPIEIEKDGKSYKVVRKANLLKNTGTFKDTTIIINETEIPALVSEFTNITLVGIKSDDGEVKMYVYDNGLKEEYHELTDNQTSIIPLELKKRENEKIYQIESFVINDISIDGYYLEKNKNQIIIYAKDTNTGNDNYYLYDLLTDTYLVYRFGLDDYLSEKIKLYNYILIGCASLIFILFIICIFKGRKNKKHNQDVEVIINKKESKKEDKKKEKNDRSEFDFDIDYESMEIKDIKEDKKKVKEEKEEPKEENSEKENVTKEINIIDNANRKLTKEEKKLAKEQQKLIEENKKKKK